MAGGPTYNFVCPMRFLLFILVTCPLLLFGQPRGEMDRVRARYELGDYAAVIRGLGSSDNLVRSDPEAALLLAVSQFHTNDLTAAKSVLDELIERWGEDFPVAGLYRGRVYHAQNLFDRAAVEYKHYLRTLRQGGEAWVAVVALLRNVDNAIRLGYGDGEILIDNLGPAVNTASDEFGPIPSPTGSGRVYYTSLRPGRSFGEGNTDIFFTTTMGRGWSQGRSLDPLLNTAANEALLDISDDGTQLHYYRAENGKGQFLVDTFRAGREISLVTIPLGAPLSTVYEDVSPYFGAADAIYFASRRPDGYGGLDLYRRDRLAGGGYGPAENLGPQINGPYDEVCPFVARDGRTLYYSTNDPAYSIGGFDVVSSYRVVGGRGRYTLPQNAGLPVNSAGDDTHFRLAPDTFTAFLASDRKDGYGQRDLYVVYYPTARPEMQ